MTTDPKRKKSSAGKSLPSKPSKKAHKLPAIAGYLTVAQYAAAHSVSPQAVRQWIADNRLAAVRVGAIWLIEAGTPRPDPLPPGPAPAVKAEIVGPPPPKRPRGRPRKNPEK